jgi:hypothetical protein
MELFMDVAKRITWLISTIAALAVLSCGQVKEGVTETSNAAKIPGRWLANPSEHSNALANAAENEAVVLSFRNGKYAYEPTDKGQAIYLTYSDCLRGPREYKTDKDQLVFVATPNCPEKRGTIQQLDSTTLKFADPDKPDITRVFTKIDETRYMALVKASDRKL